MNLWSVLQSFPLPVGIIIDKSEGFVVGCYGIYIAGRVLLASRKTR